MHYEIVKFCQADANVRVNLTDKGEHVLVTAGEVHLERCIRDLRETYAGVDVVVSEPGKEHFLAIIRYFNLIHLVEVNTELLQRGCTTATSDWMGKGVCNILFVGLVHLVGLD